MAAHIASGMSPVDCFLQLFDKDVLELIHKESLQYLEQYLEGNKEYLDQHPKARVHELATPYHC